MGQAAMGVVSDVEAWLEDTMLTAVSLSSLEVRLMINSDRDHKDISNPMFLVQWRSAARPLIFVRRARTFTVL